jgi:hypothetical protein
VEENCSQDVHDARIGRRGKVRRGGAWDGGSLEREGDARKVIIAIALTVARKEEIDENTI